MTSIWLADIQSPGLIEYAETVVQSYVEANVSFVQPRHVDCKRRSRMASMRADPRVSFAQLETWPEDGRRYELYDGEAIVVPAPNLRHQWIVANALQILKEHETRSGGTVGSLRST